MPTTSLKLPAELKQRAATAAQQLGISAHAFMLGAIEEAATAAEKRTRLLEDARTARNAMLDGTQGYDADEVHAYLKARAAGEKPAKPQARSWRD